MRRDLMTCGSEAAARRAERLLRCYPRRWRERYGEEFSQLLIDDISERPHSLTRTADVVRVGLLARLSAAGLAGSAREPSVQIRSGLAAVGCALSAFLTFGVAIWSQLTVGWQWSAPATTATRAAMLVMSATILAFALLAVLAVIPLALTLSLTLAGRRGRAPQVLQTLMPAVLGTAVLILGSLHFGHGWPGTGGHPWSGRNIVPGEIARFCWAATLWITSYWAHPGALASFPALEIAWMAPSPAALVAALAGAAMTLQRLPLSSRILRFESWLGMIAALTMAAFLAGASSWIVSGGPGPRGLFRVGTIDWAGAAVIAAALVLAFRAAQRALAASRSAPQQGEY